MIQRIISVVNWVVGLFLILLGIAAISQGFIGLIFIMVGLLWLPPVNKFAFEKFEFNTIIVRVALFLLLIVSLVIFIGTQESKSNTKEVAEVHEPSEKQEKPQKAIAKAEVKREAKPKIAEKPVVAIDGDSVEAEMSEEEIQDEIDTLLRLNLAKLMENSYLENGLDISVKSAKDRFILNFTTCRNMREKQRRMLLRKALKKIKQL